MATETDPPDPAREDEGDLCCFRDNTTVSADAPQCLHPSSFCEFRETCPVRDAEREQRRGEDRVKRG